RVAEELRPRRGDAHLLRDLHALAAARLADVDLDAEHHSRLELARVMPVVADHRVLVAEAGAVRDEGVALRMELRRQPARQPLAELVERCARPELRDGLADELARDAVQAPLPASRRAPGPDEGAPDVGEET